MGHYTSQQQIEDISRSQLNELFHRHEWIPNDIKRDTGEDIIVRIYDNRKWSGLSFYVQLKGTQDIGKLTLKTEDVASYSIETADILHWADASLPVIFIIWDIEKHAGVWKTISNVTSDLDQQNPNWREQTTVNVKFPLDNTMDSPGLKRLRYAIADYSYPLISQGKSLDMNLSLRIPQTPDGKKFMEELQKFNTKGGQVTIPPEFIASLTTSDWHQKLYGEVIFSQEHPILIESRTDENPTPTRFDIIAPDGRSASLPYIELKVIRHGSDEILLSNDHQDSPIHLEITINEGLKIELNLDRPGKNVQDLLDAHNFAKIFFTPNSKLYLMPYTASYPLMLESPNVTTSQMQTNDGFYELIEKLCHIQAKTGKYLALKSLFIDEKAAQGIDELYDIVMTGSVVVTNSPTLPSLTYPLVELALEAVRTGQAMTYSTKGADTIITVLDTEFHLGVANWEIVGIPQLSEEDLQEILDKMQPDDKSEISFLTIQGKAEFSSWQQ